jgi:signal transduction histidine kinase
MFFRLPSEINFQSLSFILKTQRLFLNRKKVRWDWKNVKSITPSGFSLLSTVLDLACECNAELKQLNLNSKKAKLHPIAFYKKNCDYPDTSIHNLNAKLALNRCYEGGLNLEFQALFTQKFGDLCGPDLEFQVLLVINELMQNAVDHSSSERYYVFAGIVDNNLEIGVLDQGVGIPPKLEQKYVCNSDNEYIELSFKEGISTRRLRKGGLGLFHTFWFVKNLEGSLVMLSRNGGIRRYFSHRKLRRMNLRDTLRGTWCYMSIPLGSKYDDKN